MRLITTYSSYNIGDDIQTLGVINAIENSYDGFINRDSGVATNKEGVKIDILTTKVDFLLNGYWNDVSECDWLFSDNINIIPLGLHLCNRGNTDEIWKELAKKIKCPIGCRDYQTVEKLHSWGFEDAYYFGCFSSLVKLTKEYEKDREIAEVDVGNKPFREMQYTHMEFDSRTRYSKSPMERLEIAQEKINNYSRYKKIKTTRLHCCVPCKSIGMDVEYIHHNREKSRTVPLIEEPLSGNKDAIRNILGHNTI